MLAAALPLALVAGAFVSNTAEAKRSPDCDRQCLAGIADQYFAALTARDPSKVPAAPGIKYTETGKFKKLGEGIWKTVTGAPTYRLSLYDPGTGGIGVHAVVPEGAKLTLMAVRMKVENRKLTEVESILIPEDASTVMKEPRKLTSVSQNFKRKIPFAERDSRYALMAAADGYFRAFETEGTPEYVKAPLLFETLRYENGMQTTNAAVGNFPPSSATQQFDGGAFKGAVVADRRYPVVDREVGAVMSLVRFGEGDAPLSKMNADGPLVGSTFMSEIFAVSQGKIVEVQAMWIPPLEQLATPFPVDSVPVSDDDYRKERTLPPAPAAPR